MPSTPSQKRWYEKKKTEIEKLPKILCICGCGKLIAPISTNGKPQRYFKGHGTKGLPNPRLREIRLLGDKPLTRAEITKRYRDKRLLEIEQMPKIHCACGCGTLIAPYGKQLIPILYAQGHNPGGEQTRFSKGQRAWNEGQSNTWAIGELNHNWNGGSSKLRYGNEFNNRHFKRMIRERDQYTCQRCGIHQSELKRAIDIHHMDFNKFNNDPSNLVCACNKCNIWANHHKDEFFINPEIWQRTHP